MAEINHLIGIKGSLEAVYGAIGTVEGLKEWWTADTIGSSEVGATIHFRFGKIGAQDMKVTELKKNARSLSANVPAKCADLMFSVPKDQVRWIDSGDFQSDLGSFIPELKDWMDARCDKRTDVEKAMWEALKDKLPAQMTPTEKSVSDLLLKMAAEQDKCESEALSELSHQTHLRMFPEPR